MIFFVAQWLHESLVLSTGKASAIPTGSIVCTGHNRKRGDVKKKMYICLPSDLYSIVVMYIFDLDKDEDIHTFMTLVHSLKCIKHLQSILSEYEDEKKIECFTKSCILGDLSTCTWFMRRGWINPSRLSVPFFQACEHGQLHIAKYLESQFKCSKSVHDYFGVRAFQQACKNGHLIVAQWITKNFAVSAQDIRTRAAFSEACCNGHLLTAKWLKDKFDITKEEMRDDGKFTTFKAACMGRHFHVAQWLGEASSIKLEIDQGVICALLVTAAKQEDLIFVQWLIKHFNITRDTFKKYLFMHVALLCRQTAPIIIQWLVKQLNLSKEDVIPPSGCPTVFSMTCVSNNLEVSRWFVKEFHITREDIQIQTYLFDKVREMEQETLQWLTKEFALLLE